MKKILLIFFAVHIVLPIYAMENEQIQKNAAQEKFKNAIEKYASQKPLSQEARNEIEYCLNQGIDVNSRIGFYRETALIHAVSNLNKELFQFLLQKGANINAQDNLEKTPLYIALLHQKFFCIAKFDIEEDFLKHKADTNAKVGGSTLIHLAIQFNAISLMKLLIKYNANINAKDNYQYSPLKYAIDGSNFSAIKELCDRGVSLINIDSNQYNAFHAAIEKKLPSMYINLFIKTRFDSYDKEIDEQLEKKIITAYLALEKSKIFPKDIQITILSHLALNYFYGFNRKFCKWLSTKNKSILLTYAFNKVNYLEQILQSKNNLRETPLQLLHARHKNSLYIQEVESLVDVKNLQQDQNDFINGSREESNLVAQIYKHSEELLEK